MPNLLGKLRSNLAYEFIAVGVVWAVIAIGQGLVIMAWPTLTCIAAGLLLKFSPVERLNWSWSNSSAVLGLLLCGYQAYVAIPFISGAFSTVATETLAGFAAFAVVHLTLLYAGYTPGGKNSEPVES